MTYRRSPSRLFAIATVIGLSVSARADEPPLSRQINELMRSSLSASEKVAIPTTDATFLRRAYLDLIGSIPTEQDARAFLDDKAPDKRAKLIDHLLNSPEHARHFSQFLDITLLERRSGRNIPPTEWLEYLRKSVSEDKPWDQLVREILSSDGADPKNRAPAKFYLVRNAEPNLVTRDIARLFLGMNVECAQCHDHPIVDAYRQEHYYGIYAFLNRTSVVRDAKLKRNVLSEKAQGEVTFSSVFDPKKLTKKTGPRAPGRAMIKEPKIPKGKEYKVKPKKNVRGVPAFSRRALLGPELTKADYIPFARNIANRLWAYLMGRGLVDPVDMHHPDNPPSHPKVLDLLTKELIAQKFRIRSLLQELMLTEVYQRSSIPPNGEERDEGRFTVARLKPLFPEALGRAMLQATGMTDVYRKSLGKKLSEARLHNLLNRQTAPLVRVLQAEPGEVEDLNPTLEQALFISNNALIRTWLTPRSGNLIDRLSKMKDVTALAQSMYLSVLTRLPTQEEINLVKDHLSSNGQTTTALQEYLWALIASAEFRFNH